MFTAKGVSAKRLGPSQILVHVRYIRDSDGTQVGDVVPHTVKDRTELLAVVQLQLAALKQAEDDLQLTMNIQGVTLGTI